MTEQKELEATQESSPKPSGKRKNLVFGGVLLGIMIAEGVAVAVVVKHFAPTPVAVEAAALPGGHGGLNPAEGQKKPEDVEVEIANFRAQNTRARQVMTYDVSVVAKVSADKEAEFKSLLEKKKAAIQDRFTSTVRAADPQILAEPDPATLRQAFQRILADLIGNEEMVKAVYIPQFVSYRAE
jgi:flagellar basal body-associated protein FliL